MTDATIPCPAAGRGGSGIGGATITACLFCGEMNASTAITHHRPVVLADLAERLLRADDYEVVVAERDHARKQVADLKAAIRLAIERGDR